MLKYIFSAALITLTVSSFGQDFKATNEEYDISAEMIGRAVHRTKYFVKDGFFASGMSSQEFIKEAEREKPTVIYLHGCNNTFRPPEDAIRKFYLGLGFNFAETNFINRGDATAACQMVNGVLVVRTNLPKRLPARALELHSHIDWLKEHGFKKIYVVGYSEGGMVIQHLQSKIDGAVIHAMICLPRLIPTKETKYLQLLSTNDPTFPRQVIATCQGLPDHETFTYSVGSANSHDPFSDPSWAGVIKKFLGVTE